MHHKISGHQSIEPISVRIHQFGKVDADGIPDDSPDYIYKCTFRDEIHQNEQDPDCWVQRESSGVRIDTTRVELEYVVIQATWAVSGGERVAASWAYRQ